MNETNLGQPQPEGMEELSALRQENQDLHGHNAALRQQLAVAQFETTAVSLREKHLTQQIEQARGQAEQARKEAEQAAQALRSLHETISWRITKPLRWVRRHLVARRKTPPPPAVPAPSPPVVPAPSLALPLAPPQAIGVFVHIHYDDLAAELAGYIRRIPDPKQIYVSTDTAAKAEHIGRQFAAAGLGPATVVRVFPNRGFDIAPFLVGFAAEISLHSLIVRLHGKKSSQLGEDAGTAWRRLLLDSLLGDATRIGAILSAFERFPDLGLVCPDHWEGLYRLYDAPLAVGSNLAAMAALLGRYNVPLAAGTPIDFPSGSMFWCRSQALIPWLRFGFSWDSFDESSQEARDASLAHALERSFLFGCELEGLTWARAGQLPGSACGVSAAG